MKLGITYLMINKNEKAESYIELPVSEKMLDFADTDNIKNLRFEAYEHMIITDTVRKIARLQGYFLDRIISIELVKLGK